MQPVSAALAVMQNEAGALPDSKLRTFVPTFASTTPVSPVTPLSVLVHVLAAANWMMHPEFVTDGTVIVFAPLASVVMLIGAQVASLAVVEEMVVGPNDLVPTANPPMDP